MVQFLNDNDTALGKEFYSMTATIYNKRTSDLKLFKDNPYQIQSFIDVAGLYSEISGYLTQDQWRKVGDYIMKNADKVGTYNFYIDIFGLIFGGNASILFDVKTTAPGVLGITIAYDASVEENRITDENEQRIIDNGEDRVVSIVNEIITVQNIYGILSKIVPGGIWVNVNISIM